MIYQDQGDNYARDIVVSPSGGLDRTPCGAGTGAKITKLFTEGRLEANKDYVLESFIGTQFVGRVLQPAKVGPYAGAVPQIKGSAFITGMHQFVLDIEDPLTEGFLL
jgi:proline racemase